MMTCLQNFNNILNRSKNYFSQLFNAHKIHDIRQRKVHIAESLVSQPSPRVQNCDLELKTY
jgi:hypothetical protein